MDLGLVSNYKIKIQSLKLINLFVVVTGASEGIGRAYALEVRLPAVTVSYVAS